ncbi:adhesive plaque matrix protein-like [Toxorhynchites rutilus septentrionalis]|uniref:adhesive plaque matrix protein-like n=1 Tax=Toxorhynchites rutilus septentrionalis TaxID=329112 RepID=UPI00247AB696|nr:adhesive plaque matrix protein-like [Toxorhynchites rutilus septentrionalis]
MALQIVALLAGLACVSAGYIQADHGHYSSAPAVSYSSVTHHASPKVAVAKTVEYAQPAVHYTVPQSYAVHEPSVLKTVVAQPTYTYGHAAPLAYSAPAKTLAYAPVAKTIVAQPAYTNVYATQPAYTKTLVQQPSYAYTQAAPLVKNLEYTNTLSYAPLAKTIVSQPAYTKVYNAEPAYTKTIVAQPAYSYAQAAPIVKNLQYSTGLSYAPLAKTIVAQPSYSKVYAAQPTYAQTVVAQPSYAKTLVSEPIYAHAAPAGHVSQVSYADNSAHYGW